MESALQQLLEKEAIKETLTRYAIALDSDNLELFDEVFSSDAVVDYSSCGGVHGSYQEMRVWMKEALSNFTSWQHLLSNFTVDLNGTTATTTTACYNPLAGVDEQGRPMMVHVGCQYNDILEKTAAGWRISKRDLVIVWQN